MWCEPTQMRTKTRKQNFILFFADESEKNVFECKAAAKWNVNISRFCVRMTVRFDSIKDFILLRWPTRKFAFDKVHTIKCVQTGYFFQAKSNYFGELNRIPKWLWVLSISCVPVAYFNPCPVEKLLSWIT